MRIITYHYVHGGNSTPPYGYYHLDIEDFRRQLDFLESNFRILDCESWVNTVQGDRSPKKNDIVLTFDDGLRDHHEHVLPELVERGHYAFFYVPAGPYLNDTVLDVHRTHSLIGAHGGAAVMEALTHIVTEKMVSKEDRRHFESEIYEAQDNQSDVERAKRLLNYYLSYEERTEVLNSLESRLSDEPLRPGEVYMSESQVADLFEAGMHVGSHSVTHTAMSKLSPTEQKKELTRSLDFLSDLLPERAVQSYCHPYGGAHSYTDETISLLENTECLFSFDVDSRPVTRTVLRNERHHIPRYDCNEFHNGDATVSLG